MYVKKDSGTLTIHLENIEAGRGSIRVGIYDKPDFFLKAPGIIEKKIHPEAADIIHISDLPYGKYAIAFFQDTNNNGNLDTNIFGIPNEPFAFSRPLKSKWSRPTYEDVQFTFSSSEKHLNIRLSRWKDL